MFSSKLLGVATIGYLICSAMYVSYLFFRNEKFGKVITLILGLSLSCQIVGWGLRWSESYKLGYGHIPLTNFYESLISVSWTTVLIYLIIEYRFKIKTLGAIVLPIVSLAMACASLSPNINDKIEPLIPSLQSNWLTYHVITCFLSYSAFAVSFGASIVYLIKNKKGETKADLFPSQVILDEMIYKTIAIGFLFLSVGIITGAIWADITWGNYWSWDPKETWSLITWFIYSAFLHARFTMGWKGPRTAILSIIGFAAVLFTFLGVSFLLPGLHSYAG